MQPLRLCCIFNTKLKNKSHKFTDDYQQSLAYCSCLSFALKLVMDKHAKITRDCANLCKISVSVFGLFRSYIYINYLIVFLALVNIFLYFCITQDCIKYCHKYHAMWNSYATLQIAKNFNLMNDEKLAVSYKKDPHVFSSNSDIVLRRWIFIMFGKIVYLK